MARQTKNEKAVKLPGGYRMQVGRWTNKQPKSSTNTPKVTEMRQCTVAKSPHPGRHRPQAADQPGAALN